MAILLNPGLNVGGHLPAHHLPRNGLLSLLLLVTCGGVHTQLSAAPLKTRIALVDGDQASNQRLVQLRKDGFTSVAFMLTKTVGTSDSPNVDRAERAGLEVDYWIEIGRNPALADAHPEWMASIQTHKEWRRFFPQFPAAPSNSVVKVYPCDTIGALLLYRTLERDLPVYHKPAGWVAEALGFFQRLPFRYQPEGLAADRLLPVLEGWDVTPQEIDAQITRATEAGANGVVVAFTSIDQSWSPRMFTLPATDKARER